MSDLIKEEQIISDLKNIVEETFKIDTTNISADTKLFDGGLSLNSIQMIELTISIERFYNKQFDETLLIEDNFRDFITLAKIINNYINDGSVN